MAADAASEPMVLSVVDQTPASERSSRRFDDLFRHYYPRLIGLAERMLGDRTEAEDVLQEAFLRLARSGHTEMTNTSGDSMLDRPDEVVGAWLRRVVLNLGVNRLRERRRSAERLERAQRLDPALDPWQSTGEAGSPAQQVLRDEARAEVRAVLATLPERQRDCLLLRYAGHSYAEIASTLGLALGSVGVYLARAERAFRVTYEATTLSRELMLTDQATGQAPLPDADAPETDRR
jgi:RNA polymerase sigma-70 factor (ECF subfamily)